MTSTPVYAQLAARVYAAKDENLTEIPTGWNEVEWIPDRWNGFSAGVIGGAQTDVLDGGGGADILIGGAGIDLLTSGEGDDALYGGLDDDQLKGGAGHDRYVIEGRDTIEDSDGIGSIRNKAGQRIAGAVEKRGDGSYVFLSDTTITVAGGADLTLTLADGSGVAPSKTKKHCHLSRPSRGRRGGRSIYKSERVSAFTGTNP